MNRFRYPRYLKSLRHAVQKDGQATVAIHSCSSPSSRDCTPHSSAHVLGRPGATAGHISAPSLLCAPFLCPYGFNSCRLLLSRTYNISSFPNLVSNRLILCTSNFHVSIKFHALDTFDVLPLQITFNFAGSCKLISPQF
jgi:hypothetical protein